MKATYRNTIEAETKEALEEAFLRLTLNTEGLNIEANHTIRRKGKLWLGVQTITTTPNEFYKAVKPHE